MKKTILIIVIILLAGIIYLNRVYAHIYNIIGEKNLPNPTTVNETLLGGMPAFPGYYKILFLGDSLTAGIGASDFQKTYALLVADYHSTYTDTEKRMTQMMNLAQPGATTNSLIKNQLTKGIEFNPDEVFILIGINDMHGRMPLNNFSENLQKIIQNFVDAKKIIRLINIPYLGDSQSFLPPYQTYFNWQTQRYNQIIKQVADKFALKLIDVYTLTVEKFKKDHTLYSIDLFHPNDDGYQLIANQIVSSLNN